MVRGSVHIGSCVETLIIHSPTARAPRRIFGARRRGKRVLGPDPAPRHYCGLEAGDRAPKTPVEALYRREGFGFNRLTWKEIEGGLGERRRPGYPAEQKNVCPPTRFVLRARCRARSLMEPWVVPSVGGGFQGAALWQRDPLRFLSRWTDPRSCRAAVAC